VQKILHMKSVNLNAAKYKDYKVGLTAKKLNPLLAGHTTCLVLSVTYNLHTVYFHKNNSKS